MNDHPHSHDDSPGLAAPAETPVDAGSQALSEALRSSFAIIRVVMIVLIVVFFASGFFTVGPSQRAIILRFGKPLGEGENALLGPGKLHWSFPYPIDECVKVNITGIQQVDSAVGWYAQTPTERLSGIEPPAPAGTPMNPAVDGYVLTADNNILHTRATLRYRINDPIRYVFNFVNASNAVQNTLDNALLSTASQFKVDDVLTLDVAGFQVAVRRRVMQLVEQQELGIAVEQCVVQSIRPRQLKEAFDRVTDAAQTRGKVLNEARSYENQVTNRSSADAESRINLAQSDRARLVSDVAAQADRFQEILPQYQRQPSLFVQQRLTETLGRVLTNVQDKIFVAESLDGKPKELRLLLNRELIKKAEEQKP
ncbi:MAG: protease modulator HflK [Verrucomicrobiota bacterium]